MAYVILLTNGYFIKINTIRKMLSNYIRNTSYVFVSIVIICFNKIYVNN